MQPQTQSKIIGLWLFACLLLVAAIMIEDATLRLREGGLSMSEWRPASSYLSPSDNERFEKEFEIYKSLPQFAKAFPNVGIDEFKIIYLEEYANAMLRYILIAAVVLPFLLFIFLRIVAWPGAIKLSLVFLFGGLQYVAHAYAARYAMLDDPQYIPYLLSMQLALQFAFFGLILWQILSFTYPRQGIGGFELPKPTAAFKVSALVILAVIFLQIVLGGAVNGLHAGLSFNTFPLMDGEWVPDDLWPLPQWYRNLFEDASTAQFVHRLLAYALFLMITAFWIAGHNNPHIAHLLPILFSVFIVQFLLGVLTLLFAVPVPLSSLHQANALLVFGIAVTIAHRLFIPIKTISYDII